MFYPNSKFNFKAPFEKYIRFNNQIITEKTFAVRRCLELAYNLTVR
jgi:hypothetical protein